MKKWPIYSDFSILSHNSGNFGQNEKQVLFSEGATSGTEPNRFPESSSVMCHNVVYQWSGSEHCPTIPLQAHCDRDMNPAPPDPRPLGCPLPIIHLCIITRAVNGILRNFTMLEEGHSGLVKKDPTSYRSVPICYNLCGQADIYLPCLNACVA